jgi:hypothetical protein
MEASCAMADVGAPTENASDSKRMRNPDSIGKAISNRRFTLQRELPLALSEHKINHPENQSEIWSKRAP